MRRLLPSIFCLLFGCGAVRGDMEKQIACAGKVVDSAGKAVAGARVFVYRYGCSRCVFSDAAGRFRVAQTYIIASHSRAKVYLIVRQMEKNLAAAVLLDNGTRTDRMAVVAAPGATIKGRVVDAKGRPIAKAAIQLLFWTGDQGATFDDLDIVTDTAGRYEIKALPAGQTFFVGASASGYGQKNVTVRLDDHRRREFEVSPLALPAADVPLAGTVVDNEGNPVPKARVDLYGGEQPGLSTTTDAEGNFRFGKVCRSEAQIAASAEGTESGYATATGGDCNVRIMLRNKPPQPESGPRSRLISSLAGRSLPDLAEFGARVDPKALKGKRVVVCFLDVNGRSSRHVAMKLWALSGDLKEKNAAVMLVQAVKAEESAVKEWRAKSGIAFPVGRMAKESSRTLEKWGVRTVPWLILTDPEHMVTAEGFGVDSVLQRIEDKPR